MGVPLGGSKVMYKWPKVGTYTSAAGEENGGGEFFFNNSRQHHHNREILTQVETGRKNGENASSTTNVLATILIILVFMISLFGYNWFSFQDDYSRNPKR